MLWKTSTCEDSRLPSVLQSRPARSMCKFAERSLNPLWRGSLLRHLAQARLGRCPQSWNTHSCQYRNSETRGSMQQRCTPSRHLSLRALMGLLATEYSRFNALTSLFERRNMQRSRGDKVRQPSIHNALIPIPNMTASLRVAAYLAHAVEDAVQQQLLGSLSRPPHITVNQPLFSWLNELSSSL